MPRIKVYIVHRENDTNEKIFNHLKSKNRKISMSSWRIVSSKVHMTSKKKLRLMVFDIPNSSVDTLKLQYLILFYGHGFVRVRLCKRNRAATNDKDSENDQPSESEAST